MSSQSTFDFSKYANAMHLLTSKANPPVPYAGAQQLDYSEYLKQARTGDVLLFYGTDDVSKAIQIFTNGPFEHCALLFRGALPDEDASESATKSACCKQPRTPWRSTSRATTARRRAR